MTPPDSGRSEGSGRCADPSTKADSDRGWHPSQGRLHLGHSYRCSSQGRLVDRRSPRGRWHHDPAELARVMTESGCAKRDQLPEMKPFLGLCVQIGRMAMPSQAPSALRPLWRNTRVCGGCPNQDSARTSASSARALCPQDAGKRDSHLQAFGGSIRYKCSSASRLVQEGPARESTAMTNTGGPGHQPVATSSPSPAGMIGGV